VSTGSVVNFRDYSQDSKVAVKIFIGKSAEARAKTFCMQANEEADAWTEYSVGHDITVDEGE
jgi:hypothetical protein